MRGKEVAKYAVKPGERITPAYAGKSVTLGSLWLSLWDHPCICGEKEFQKIVLDLIIGSPLHMRGKADEFSDIEVVDGITPAYAGKSRRC